MPFFKHFELDIVSALIDQLLEAFDDLEHGALTAENVSQLPEQQGIYELYRGQLLVYVGKVDKNLRARLSDHRAKISGRKNISVEEIFFKCLSLPPNWAAYAPEKILIRHFQRKSLAAWNGIGFGPHDPGRERETTNKPPDGFDAKFPIEERFRTGIRKGEWNGRELLQATKRDLPFLLRYETTNPKRWREGHPDYNDLAVSVPRENMTAEDLLRAIARQLPVGWQATRFTSHMILYKEKRSYAYGTVVWPAEQD